MATLTQLPLPPHYVEGDSRQQDYYVADVNGLLHKAVEWRGQHGIQPVGSDRKRIHALLIDAQYDFSSPQGSLYVGGQSGNGAMDDAARMAEWVYRNLGVISEITMTLDSHLLYQIFVPSAHLLSDGSHPAPFTVITEDDYRSGKYEPNPAMAKQLNVDATWLRRQFVHYCHELKAGGRYDLSLWPYHCLIGSHGHKLSGVVDAARQFHAFVRGAKNDPEVKGGNPLTENYSIFGPEVTTLHSGGAIPGAQKNTRLIEALLRADYVVIAGQAASHCVAWTIKDLLRHILANDPSLAKKVYIMHNCTSSVVIPGLVDYTPQTEAAFAEFQNAGMHLVNSTDPIESWPGIELVA